MADIALVFRKPRRVTIDSLTVDATLSELHTTEVELTDHPVETGANVVDHARRKPDGVQIEGIVSNTPLGLTPKPFFRYDEDTPQGRPFFEVLNDPDLDPTRAETAFAQLQALADGTPITIRTTLREYTDMVLESLSVPRSVQLGNAVQFTAKFRQVRFVSSRTVVTPAAGKLAGKRKLGKKQPVPAAPVEGRTVLKQLSDSLVDWWKRK